MNTIEKMEEQIRELEAKVEKLYLILNITPDDEQNEKHSDASIVNWPPNYHYRCLNDHMHETALEAAACPVVRLDPR